MALNTPFTKKTCFVTIGATASFDALIENVLSHPFLEALRSADYTDLILQHGKTGGEIVERYQEKTASEANPGIKVRGFDFKKHGLMDEMAEAKAGGTESEGVVISHAGQSCGIVSDGQTLTLA